MINTLEHYQQTHTYDTGNNLTALSHQANSGNWQQTLAIHPNSNRGTSLALYLLVRFSYSANSLALVIINIVLCGVAFVCFSEFVKGIVVIPI
jgi:hypothetical protein